MKLKTLLFIFSVALLISCSTAYKSGQTPDDLYYSKGKVVKTDNSDRYEQTDDSYQYSRLRMAAYDPRWRTLDDLYDYNCSYTPYSYGYTYGYYYNPYYYPYPVYSPGIKFINPKSTVIRTVNLHTYSNTVSTYTPGNTGSTRVITVRGYHPVNSYTGRVNNTGRSYTPDNSNSNSNNSSSSNTHSGSSSSNSGSSSSGSVSRPSRGN